MNNYLKTYMVRVFIPSGSYNNTGGNWQEVPIQTSGGALSAYQVACAQYPNCQVSNSARLVS